MAVAAFQRGRPLPDGRVEVARDWQSAPPIAVPAAPTQPCLSGQTLRGCAQQSQAAVERWRSIKIDLPPCDRVAAKMNVSVDKTGHDCATAHIEDPRAWSPQIIEAVVATGHDSARGDRQIASPRLSRVERVDGGTLEQYLGVHRATIVSAMIVLRAEY
jgi:hypothetical protein